jgi:hypothetical protein
MKVFKCYREGCFGTGVTFVAANSLDEAYKTFVEDEYVAPISDLYPIQGWSECKELTANVDKPCVLMEEGFYSEVL